MTKQEGLDTETLQKHLVGYGKLVDLNMSTFKEAYTIVATFASKSSADKLISQSKASLYLNLT